MSGNYRTSQGTGKRTLAGRLALILIFVSWIGGFLAFGNEKAPEKKHDNTGEKPGEVAAKTAAPGKQVATQPKAEESKGGGEAEEGKPTPAPTPALGPELDGYFDLSVFRATSKVTNFRKALDPLILGLSDRWKAKIQATVEFGNASGVEELTRLQPDLIHDLQSAGAEFGAAELRTSGGKQHLKDALIVVLNRRLKTAQVRRIFFTDFRIGR